MPQEKGFGPELTSKAGVPPPPRIPNPRRVAAGQRNRRLRRGLTEDGRRRLRAAALRHQPWRAATGPSTAEGRQRAQANLRRTRSSPEREQARELIQALQAHLGNLQPFIAYIQTKPP